MVIDPPHIHTHTHKKNGESIYSSSNTVSVVLFLFFQKFLDVVDIFMHSML